MKTICKNCCFAEYDGVIQTGCKAGYLEKFLARDKADMTYDEEKQFYMIHGLCPVSRSHSWAEKKGHDVGAAKKEASLKYHIIVSPTEHLKIIGLLANLNIIEPFPVKITINNLPIHNNDGMEYAKILRSSWQQNGLIWKVNVFVENFDIDYQIVQSITKHKNLTNFLVIYDGTCPFPYELLKTVNNMVIEDLRVFAMVKTAGTIIIPSILYETSKMTLEGIENEFKDQVIYL